MKLVSVFAAVVTTALATLASAQEDKVLNLYSSRHYNTDEALYANFTKLTGIKINRIEAGDDAIIERIRSEGAKSPADVLVTVDVGRLYRAEQLGLLAPTQSKTLADLIPAELRHPDGLWYGFSVRGRPIYYNKANIKPGDIKNYEDLADPKFKGKVCTRSGSHPYNLSLMASLINALGPDKAEQWAKGVVANFAREPKGGDTDQIKAVATGECQIALGNTYYFVRMMKSSKPEDQDVVSKVGVIFPNQDNRGTHVNISGAGVVKTSPRKENAIKFLEYLASPEAQDYFANGNNEYPVNQSRVPANPELVKLGNFKRDTARMEALGKNQATAQMIYDRAGWK